MRASRAQLTGDRVHAGSRTHERADDLTGIVDASRLGRSCSGVVDHQRGHNRLVRNRGCCGHAAEHQSERKAAEPMGAHGRLLVVFAVSFAVWETPFYHWVCGIATKIVEGWA